MRDQIMIYLCPAGWDSELDTGLDTGLDIRLDTGLGTGLEPDCWLLDIFSLHFCALEIR